MKNLKFLLFTSALFLTFSCSKNDDALTEDGVNKAPNQRSTGSSAHDFLSADKYKSLVIEITYAGNLAPNQQTITNLQQFFNAKTNKPNSITIVTKQIPAQQGSPFSSAKITQIEDAN